MTTPRDEPGTPSLKDTSLIRAHPVMLALGVACTGIGICLGLALLPGDWSWLHRAAAGAVGGAGVALLVFATRLIA